MKTTSISLTEEEQKLLEKKAKEIGLKISQYMRMVSITKAKEK